MVKSLQLTGCFLCCSHFEHRSRNSNTISSK